MALTKISGNVVQQNNFSLSGVVTATSFTGDLTGNVTGNVTGTATTATNLADGANITTGTISNDRLPSTITKNLTGDVTGNLTGNVTGTATTATNLADGANITTGTISNDRLPSTITKNLTGDVTGNLTGNVSSSGANTLGSLTVTNDATVGGALTVTGNLTVNGTTTTIDTVVTAIDSLAVDGDVTVGGNLNVTGVSTFQGNVDLGDDDRLRFGASQDLQIYHDSTSGKSHIKESGPGLLQVDTNNFSIRNSQDTEQLAYFTENAGVGLYYDNTKTFETTSIGAKVIGDLNVTGILTVGQNSTTINGTLEYPSIRPTLDLNFAATKTLDRRITFTRDSLGTYTDELGVLKYASNNTPRFDHDPDTGESLGLLIEESRTNLVTHSVDFSNSAWAENGASESLASSVTAPDGTTGSVYELIESSATSGHFMYDSISVSSNTNYTWSVWMKANTRTYGYMTEGNTQGATAYFDLSTGTVNKTSGTGSPSATAQKYPNGWVRCTMTFTTGASQTSANVQFGPNLDGTTFSYAGDGSSGIYVWGGQGEAGSFATSYIPTSGSTVTRAADIAKITGTNFTDFYNQTEGTVFSSHQTYSGLDNNENSYVYQISNNDSSQVAFRLIDKNTYYGSPSLLTATQWSNDVQLQKSGATNGERIRTAFACKVNDAAVSYNGATVLTDTSLDMNSGQTSMGIGLFQTSPQAYINGHIQQITYYNKRLPNAQLQGLTAQ